MKRTILGSTFAATLLAASPALVADSYDNPSHTDYAQVVDVTPITQQIRVDTPRRECWQESAPVHHSTGYQTYTPQIVGAVLGAAVGRQFGRGRGQDAATVAGAVLGGSIGRDIKHRRYSPPQYSTGVVERCRTVHDAHTEERVVGYRVRYDYQGRVYTTRTHNDPGDRIQVRVHVTPITS